MRGTGSGGGRSGGGSSQQAPASAGTGGIVAAFKRAEKREGVVSCPVCSMQFPVAMSNNDIRLHVNNCLAAIEDDF
jgi:hypothetical protein